MVSTKARSHALVLQWVVDAKTKGKALSAFCAGRKKKLQ